MPIIDASKSSIIIALTAIGVAGTLTVFSVLGTPPTEPEILDQSESFVIDEVVIETETFKLPMSQEAARELESCIGNDISLTLALDFDTKIVIKRLCMSQADYDLAKKALVDEYDLDKESDFDINHRDILSAIINREVSIDGGFDMAGLNSTEDLKRELIDLLR